MLNNCRTRTYNIRYKLRMYVACNYFHFPVEGCPRQGMVAAKFVRLVFSVPLIFSRVSRANTRVGISNIFFTHRHLMFLRSEFPFLASFPVGAHTPDLDQAQHALTPAERRYPFNYVA